jgi:hypothetical protein
MLTTLNYDALTKRRVVASANGSVVIHFMVWSPLPDRWDPGSILTVGPGHPTALWVGDDPSNWATTGLVTAPVMVMGKGRKVVAAPPTPRLGASVREASRSQGTSVAVVTALCLGCLLIGAGTAVAFARRRRPAIGH